MNFDDLELNYSDFLPADHGARILDIGCGHGRILKHLKAKGYSHLIGVDRDEKVIEAVRAEGIADVQVVTNLRAFLADHVGEYDLIVAKDVLYYIPKGEIVETVREISRCLRPGGRLLVEVFNGAAFTGPFISFKDYQIDWIPTEHSIRAILQDAGMGVAVIRPFRAPRAGVKRRAFSWIQGMWRGVLRTAYFLERGFDPQNPRILTTKLIAATEPV